MEQIFAEIALKRLYQEGKWGNVADDTLNTPWMWAAYIGLYSTKWMAGTWAPLKSSVADGFRAAMVDVAALAVAAIQSIDRQRANTGRAFYEESGQ